MVERIKAAASKRGLTLAQLEQRLGFGIRTIYKWDRNSPSVEKVLSVANFLQVPLRWLITGEKGPEDVDWELVQKYDRLSYGDQRKIDHFIEICLSPLGPKGSRALSDSSRGAGRIPVLGYIAEDIPIEGLRIPMDYIGSRETADYAMVVRDSSLSPEFEKGDYLFIEKAAGLNTGDVGIFYSSGMLFCRRYQQNQEQIVLSPFSRRGTLYSYSADAPGRFHLQGRVLPHTLSDHSLRENLL